MSEGDNSDGDALARLMTAGRRGPRRVLKSKLCSAWLNNVPCRHRYCSFAHGPDELAAIGTRYGDAEVADARRHGQPHRPRFQDRWSVRWCDHFWGTRKDIDTYCILGNRCDKWHSAQQPTDHMRECGHHIDRKGGFIRYTAPPTPQIRNCTALIRQIIREAEGAALNGNYETTEAQRLPRA